MNADPAAAPRSPRLPSAVAGSGTPTERLGSARAPLPPDLLDRLAATGVEVRGDPQSLDEAARDWWPLTIGWAAGGAVPRRPAAVVRPVTTEEVSTVLAMCSELGVPVTPAGGRSGVCGGAVPVHGGVALDLTGITDVEVDERSLTAEAGSGVFGPDLEARLGAVGPGYTAGHWPQSMDLSTVGGWVACRGAGQYSTRYGKIEDLVAGLEVVLADGTVVQTGHEAPRAATGPSLTQLFLGCEGTLGVVTRVRLRIRPRPTHHAQRACTFDSFDQGLEVCRTVLRRGATPAVLRLYDRAETRRSFPEVEGCVLIVLDECDPVLLEATLRVVDEELATHGASPLDESVVDQWLAHRNDVSALAPLWEHGIVVDTAEVAGPWTALPGLARDVVAALQAVPGTLVASVHESHAYPDGACLYFTFAGQEPGTDPGAPNDGPGDLSWPERYYVEAWNVLNDVVLHAGCAISHHHGIGMNRARFLPAALGSGFSVLVAVKRALDPSGILNPGKLGLPSPYGDVGWP